MPDAMSPDPEVVALTEAMTSVAGLLWRDTKPPYLAENAATIVRALHAAGYRVVAAESDNASEYGRLLALRDRLIAAGVDPAELLIPAAPTEEERQHE